MRLTKVVIPVNSLNHDTSPSPPPSSLHTTVTTDTMTLQTTPDIAPVSGSNGYEAVDCLEGVEMGKPRNGPLDREGTPVAELVARDGDALPGDALGTDASEPDHIDALINRHKTLYRELDIHIEYHNLTFSVMTDATRTITDVGSLLKSALFFWRPTPKKRVDILSGATGRIQPRKMTLLLGPPGSGKSVLLKALSGRLHPVRGYSTLSGQVYYDGDDITCGKFFLPKVADYIEQGDTHEAVLTVEETFRFAWQATTGGNNAYALAKDEASAAILSEDNPTFGPVPAVVKGLGLQGCKDTYVGNAAIRGISGGQKRRVTIGELLVCPRPVKMMDCITNGLDTATAYDIIHSMRSLTTALGTTNVISLLQPPPDVYNLFDEIILLCEGRIIYHGPRTEIVPYFADLGYTRPEDVDEADFLQELPTREGQRFITSQQAPRGAQALAQAWMASKIQARMRVECKYASQTEAQEKAKSNAKVWYPDEKEKFSASFWYFFDLCFQRQIKVMLRDASFATARVGQCLVMGAIAGSLFNNIGTTEVNTMNGFLFNTMLFSALGSFAILPIVFDQKAVFYKQRSNLFFSTSSFTLAQTAAMIPLQIVEAILYVSIVYWSAGLTEEDNGSRFFVFLLLSVIFSMCVGQIYRLIASAVQDMRTAIPVSGVVIMIMILFSGFIQPKSEISDGWLWFYWLNPVSWGLKAVTVNEFLSSRYDFLTCTDENCDHEERFGNVVLRSYGNPTEAVTVWYAVAVLVGELAVFVLLTYAALEYMHTEPIPPPPLRQEDGEGQAQAGRQAPPPTATYAVVPKGGDKGEDEDIEGGGAVDSTRSGTTRQQLPFDPIVFAFKNIRYTVTTPKGDVLQLLRGVDGCFEPGSITALMGSSGAGKTTLLDVLAGRKNTGVVQGDIFLNGLPKHDAYFRKVMAYVEQFDTLSPRSTAREAITFSAELRLAPGITREQKGEWIEAVLEMLDLVPLQHEMIGEKGNGGMSIEQRKRVSIAVELVSNPSILFLDEPTTALDSRAAQSLIRHIRRIACSGRSVVCTIHQPSAAIFHAFDSLLLLQKGGATVFFGKLGEHGRGLIDYLQGLPGVQPMAAGVNPATWMLDVIGAGIAAAPSPASLASASVDFPAQYQQSSLAEANRRQVEDYCQPWEGSKRWSEDDLAGQGDYHASYWKQFVWLMRRMATTYWRTPSYSVGRHLTNVLIALIFASAYPQQDYDDYVGVVSRGAVIYITMMFCGVLSMLTAIPVHAGERAVFYFEQQARMYSKSLFALVQTLIEIPYTIVSSLAFTIPFFYIVGFDNVGDVTEKFLYFWLFSFLVQAALLYMGIFYVSLTPDEPTAQVLGGLTASLVGLFCGFLIGEQSFPPFWLFMYWLSPLHYGLEGLIVTQFHGDTTPITTMEGTVVTAEDYMRDEVFPKWSYEHVGYDVLALCLFIGLSVVGNYICLALLRNEKR